MGQSGQGPATQVFKQQGTRADRRCSKRYGNGPLIEESKMRDEVLDRLIADCGKDKALKDRFLREPKPVLNEYGAALPEDAEVRVSVDAEGAVQIEIPVSLVEDAALSDEALAGVAGGSAGMAQQTRLYIRSI